MAGPFPKVIFDDLAKKFWWNREPCAGCGNLQSSQRQLAWWTLKRWHQIMLWEDSTEGNTGPKTQWKQWKTHLTRRGWLGRHLQNNLECPDLAHRKGDTCKKNIKSQSCRNTRMGKSVSWPGQAQTADDFRGVAGNSVPWSHLSSRSSWRLSITELLRAIDPMALFVPQCNMGGTMNSLFTEDPEVLNC